MKKDLLQCIEDEVNAIYHLEMNKVENGFINLIDQLSLYIDVHPDVDWKTLLLNIQEAYTNNDYIRLSDILLYDLEPVIEEW